MLDERLIGITFPLPTNIPGEITLFGIHYHYHIADSAGPGDIVIVVKATALGLTVRRADRQLNY